MRRFHDIPVVSVVGLVALVFAFVSLIPTAIVLHQQNATLHKIEKLSASNLQLAHANRRLALLGKQSHTILCAQHENVQGQVDASRKFLLDVQTGVRELPHGFTQADITDNIRRLQSLLDADTAAGLRGCPKPQRK